MGVNKYVMGEDDKIPTLKIEHAVESEQRDRVVAVKQGRDAAKAAAAIEAVRQAAASDANLFPPILEAVRCHVTLGEVSDVFRAVFGEHRDPAYL